MSHKDRVDIVIDTNQGNIVIHNKQGKYHQ